MEGANGDTASAGPQRKVFNAIVDANALISGVKRNTRDGIKKWVNNGFIRLVVPLHTLKQLNMLATTRTDRFGSDAKDALVWLDQITEQPNITTEGWVKLQEGHEEYETWAEVEQYLLPKTLLSHTEPETPVNGSIAGDFANLQIGDGTQRASASSKGSDDFRPITPSSPDSQYSATSPKALEASPRRPEMDSEGAAPHHKKTDSAASMTDSQISDLSIDSEPRTPKSLQPLFNHIIWRINHTQSLDADQGLGSYILLTNDHLKQSIAHRFGIRVKRIEQLRDIIAREERDMRNRQTVLKKESEGAVEGNGHSPRPIGTRSSPKRPVQQAPRVFDPNAFDRAQSFAVKGSAPVLAPIEPAGRGSVRGRGGRGGRGGAFGGPSLEALQALATRPGRGRAGPAPAHQGVSRPIDPDSFERPRGHADSARGGRNGLGGGGRRKLWEPA